MFLLVWFGHRILGGLHWEASFLSFVLPWAPPGTSPCSQIPVLKFPLPELLLLFATNIQKSWAVLRHFIFLFKFIYFNWRLITILYWFCNTSTWICHGCTRVPHPEPPSHLPPCTIPLGHPSAPAPSILYPASNLDWRFVSYMILYMFQCHSPKSSHPLPLPQTPKDCSIHLCLFCCLAYSVIITIFLNSIYMC